MTNKARIISSARLQVNSQPDANLLRRNVTKYLEAIPRDTLEQRAYASIRTAIESGEFAPGSVLNIGELATRLQISVTPVREALKRLHAEQALVVLSSRALAVPVLNTLRIAEIRDLRMLIEGSLAESAALKATPDDCEYLEELRSKMAMTKDPAAFLRHNREFHFHLYGLAPLPMGHHLIDLLWLQSGPTFVSLLSHGTSLDERRAPFDVQHKAIVEAVRRSDAKAAGEAVRADISLAAAFVINMTKEQT